MSTSLELASRIKESPHMRMRLRPERYGVVVESSLSKLLELVEDNSVKYRGWDFPHLDRHTPPELADDRVVSFNDFRGVGEYWLLTTSLQFLHLNMHRESVHPENWYNSFPTSKQKVEALGADGFVDFRNLVWSLAERIEFALSVIRSFPDCESWSLTVSAHNIKNFVLLSNPSRPLFGDLKSLCSDIVWDKQLTIIDTMFRKNDIVFESVRYYLERFQFVNPSKGVIDSVYEELLNL